MLWTPTGNREWLFSLYVLMIKKRLTFHHCSFSESSSCPSWGWCIYDLWSAWWCFDKSISIGICSESGLPAYFSSSEKSCIIVSFRVFYDSDHTKIFGFFHGEFSFWIFKSLDSSEPARLPLLLGFFLCYPLFICSWCHSKMLK